VSEGPDKSRTRDPFWDNARFLAIVLVVVGHSIEEVDDTALGYGLYLFIYSFHMPLFAFISGNFAQSSLRGKNQAVKIIRQLLLPYLYFSVIWGFFRWYLNGTFELDLITPYWQLWFLVALAVWRLCLPLLAVVRAPVLASIALASIAGYFATVGSVGQIARLITFMPFFVLGWSFKNHEWTHRLLHATRSWWSRLAALTVLTVVCVMCCRSTAGARTVDLRSWLQGQQNYDDMEFHHWWGAFFRLGLIVISTLLCLVALIAIPRSHTGFTVWGTRSMYPFLLHIFPLAVLRHLGILLPDIRSNGQILGLVGSAALATALLSTKPVQIALRPLVEPVGRWLIRSDTS
jgi:fucose 4-O-acetylase-like acetyltransferase